MYRYRAKISPVSESSRDIVPTGWLLSRKPLRFCRLLFERQKRTAAFTCRGSRSRGACRVRAVYKGALTVCRKLFLNIRSARMTQSTWLGRKAKSKGQTKAAKTGKCAPVADDDERALEEWIRGIPTVPSHYCILLFYFIPEVEVYSFKV